MMSIKSLFRKVKYTVTWSLLAGIGFILGMGADTWDDEKFKNL